MIKPLIFLLSCGSLFAAPSPQEVHIFQDKVVVNFDDSSTRQTLLRNAPQPLVDKITSLHGEILTTWLNYKGTLHKTPFFYPVKCNEIIVTSSEIEFVSEFPSVMTQRIAPVDAATVSTRTAFSDDVKISRSLKPVIQSIFDAAGALP